MKDSLNEEDKCNHVDEFYAKWILSYKSNPDFPKNVTDCERAYIYFLAELSNSKKKKK